MRKLGAAVLTLAAVAGMLFARSWLSSIVPPADAILKRPFLARTTVGKPAEYLLGRVTVTGFHVAKTVIPWPPKLRPTPAETAGVFVVVDYEFVAAKPVRVLPDWSLVDAAENRYLADRTVTACEQPQPGFMIACQAVIEATPSALPGARLLLPTHSNSNLDTPEEAVVVDLEIDQAQADQLVAEAGQVQAKAPMIKAQA